MSDLAPTSASRVARPSLLMRAAKVPNEVAETRPGPLALLGTAVWFGLIAGPLELGLVLVRDRITDEVTPASLQTSRHALWMIPVSNLLIFAACGLLLALAARLAPRFGARLGLFLLPFLASLGVLLAIPGLYPIASLLLACGIAYRASRLMRSHAAGFRRVVRLSPRRSRSRWRSGSASPTTGRPGRRPGRWRACRRPRRGPRTSCCSSWTPSGPSA